MKRLDYLALLITTRTFNMFTLDELEPYLTLGTTTIKQVKKNHLLFLSGETCETLNVVLMGEVAIQKFDDNGNDLTITSFTKGQTFGDNLLFGQQNIFPFSIIAKTDGLILKIKKETIFALLQKNDQFLKVFLENISNHSFFVGQRMINLTGKSLREKIIDYIKEQQLSQKSETIVLTHTKKELAEKFSVHRPSLSRELKKMRDEHLIDYDHLKITPLKKF